MDFKKVLNGITINVNVNVTDDAMKLMGQLLTHYAKSMLASSQPTATQNVSTSVESPAEVAEQPVAATTSETIATTPRQKRKYTRRAVINDVRKNPDAMTKKQRQTVERPKKDVSSKKQNVIDIPAICNYIRECVNSVKEGDSIAEVSAALNSAVCKMSDGRLNVYLARFGRYHKVMPNFSKTATMMQKHGGHWPGWVPVERVQDELQFLNESSFVTESVAEIDVKTRRLVKKSAPLKKNAKFRKQRGYTQGSYQRVAKGSMLMRMRCHKDSTDMAPMVIDAQLAEKLFNDGYTHVKIGKLSRNNVPMANSRTINLIFTKEKERTAAEKNSDRLSRLRPYGKDGARVTTYAIGGDAFQKNILNYFGETCTGKDEKFFRLVQTGKENDKGIAYRIDQVQ